MINRAEDGVENGIENRVKNAFDIIHAEQGLKDRTGKYLVQKTRHGRAGLVPVYGSVYRNMFPVMVCCLLLLLGFGGYRVYFTPTSVISIDINPSIELGINRFDRVVSVKGYNDDGERLAAGLHVHFMDYADAVERILEDEDIARRLAQNELLSIVVVDSDGRQSREMLEQLTSCVSGHENAHCRSVDTRAVDAAHAEGLSYGKYWAFLRLKELDPNITAEDVQRMTMREITERFYLLQPDGADDLWHDGAEDAWHDGEGSLWHDGAEDAWYDGAGDLWHDGEGSLWPDSGGDDGAAAPGEGSDIPYGNGHHGKEHGHGHGKD